MELERKKGISKIRITQGNKKVLYALLVCIFLFLAVLIAIFILKNSSDNQDAISQDEDSQNADNQNTINMANPASVYCLEHNGTLFIKTLDDGSQTGYCTSKITNKTCDEWGLYRQECKF